MKGFNLLRRGDPSGAGLPRRSSLNPNPPAGGLTVNQSADFTSFNHADIYSLNILCPCMSLIVFPGALRQNKYQISQNELVSNRWHVLYKMKRLRGAHEGASSNPVSDRHTGDQFLHYIKHKPRTLLPRWFKLTKPFLPGLSTICIPIKASYKRSKVGYLRPSVLLCDEPPSFWLTTTFFSSNTRKRKRKKQTPKSKLEKAQEFRDLMTQFGWTQAELARHLGVSRAWVCRVLSYP